MHLCCVNNGGAFPSPGAFPTPGAFPFPGAFPARLWSLRQRVSGGAALDQSSQSGAQTQPMHAGMRFRLRPLWAGTGGPASPAGTFPPAAGIGSVAHLLQQSALWGGGGTLPFIHPSFAPMNYEEVLMMEHREVGGEWAGHPPITLLFLRRLLVISLSSQECFLALRDTSSI